MTQDNYAEAWSEAEIKALVQSVHFHCDNSNCMAHSSQKESKERWNVMFGAHDVVPSLRLHALHA